MMRKLSVLILLLICSMFVSNCAEKETEKKQENKPKAELILSDGFESGSLDSNIWDVTWWVPSHQLEQGIEPEIVTSPVRAGNYAVKIRAQANWNSIANYTRTELQGKRKDTGEHITFFYPGKEYWIGFSVYLPKDWQVDHKSQELIFQLHGNGNEDSPSLALVIDGTEWFWSIRWQDKFEAYEGSNRVDKGITAYEKGQWVDFVIHVKFSYKNDGNGFMQAWKNGTTLFTYNGPNCYNDGLKIRGPQTGVYKWDWSNGKKYEVSERTIYLDEFKVGNAGCTYDDVAPGKNEE